LAKDKIDLESEENKAEPGDNKKEEDNEGKQGCKFF